MKLKINNVTGFSGKIDVETDANGTPLIKFWRDRIKDSEHDNCVEIIKPATKRSKKNDDS